MGPGRDALPADCREDPDCENPNLVCREGECVALSCTQDPSVCGSVDCGDRKAVCNNLGICECEPFCADGCGADEYCCVARNACEPVPPGMCEGDCQPGFDRVLTREGQVDAETCEVQDAECECVERMPLEVGAAGRFSDLVLVDGVPYVSGYSDEFGDLVVGRLDAVRGLQWQFVDGAPAGPVVAGPSGPRGGVEEAGPDVGTHTSIARGPGGTLHVAYRDEDAGALKYAFGVPAGGSYTWRVVALDDVGGAGRYTSISVDGRGVPGIAYRVDSVAEGDTFFSEVRYRLAKNDAPGQATDWNAPFVIQRRELAQADPETGAYPEGTGLFTAQARDRDGLPVVAWYDRSLGALWLARFAGAGFSEPELLAGWGHPDPELDGDMGTNVDLAIDAQGQTHLCFQNGLDDTLRYLAPELGLDEVIDDGVRLNDGGRSYAVHVVGEDCNLRLTADGSPVVVYQDATGHDLLMARRAGGEDGGWIRRVLRGDEAMYRGAFGFYARARLDGARIWISNYVYRHEEQPAVEGLEIFSEDL